MINHIEVNIGDFVTHFKHGRIEVRGIAEHCSTKANPSYAITYDKGWVYLHNCKNLEKNKIIIN